jgi:hypothetical protein
MEIKMSIASGAPTVLIQEFHLDNDALNKELEKWVVDEIERQGGIQKEQHSNVGGWQSDRELHARLADGSQVSNLLVKLFDSFSGPMTHFINSCCIQCNLKINKSYEWHYTGAWFNVSTKGSYNAPHTHPLSEISGAYYIRTEEPTKENPFSGRIDFFYPGGDKSFFPTPGTLILFPGNTLHFVHPYYGEGHRICLSFNTNNIKVLEP